MNHSLDQLHNHFPINSSIFKNTTIFQKGSIASTSGVEQKQQHSKRARTCRFEGCPRGSRGASASTLLMEVAGGVRDCDVKKELKARRYSVRHMEKVGGANIWGARRVQKAALTTALVTVVADDVAMKAALVPQEGGRACAFDIGVGKGVRWKIVIRVLRAAPAYASRMEVVGVASILPVRKVLKGAQCFVKPMVAAKGVPF
uniref:Uncharacterized protein n=1 Tax=Nicotiana tabacum TaxID=4097 RepID=A0A1S4CNH2_TOBAC|nr:PREDICTED: uncharacterized protein LOC107820698 [Nicotiana tabacum]